MKENDDEERTSEMNDEEFEKFRIKHSGGKPIAEMIKELERELQREESWNKPGHAGSNQ